MYSAGKAEKAEVAAAVAVAVAAAGVCGRVRWVLKDHYSLLEGEDGKKVYTSFFFLLLLSLS